MKKVMLMFLSTFFFAMGNASASEFYETGNEVEVEDQAAKMFIFQTLHIWIGHDMSDYYFKKYKAKSVTHDGPEQEKIRVWIKEVKPSPGNRMEYTHVVRVFLPYKKVIIDDKKEIKAADTFIYAVNADRIPLCDESRKSGKDVKLIDSYHKELP